MALEVYSVLGYIMRFNVLNKFS